MATSPEKKERQRKSALGLQARLERIEREQQEEALAHERRHASVDSEPGICEELKETLHWLLDK